MLIGVCPLFFVADGTTGTAFAGCGKLNVFNGTTFRSYVNYCKRVRL